MDLGSVLGIIASAIAIIGGIFGGVSFINTALKRRAAIITASLEGSFPRNHIEITNRGSHIARNLKVDITGCYAHKCDIQDLYPGESIEVLVAIDKDTQRIDLDCSWKDGRVGCKKYHRTLLAR